MLTERLEWLVGQRVLERRIYTERPPRYEYVLTEKGSELADVLLAITAWVTAGPQARPVRRLSSATGAAAS